MIFFIIIYGVKKFPNDLVFYCHFSVSYILTSLIYSSTIIDYYMVSLFALNNSFEDLKQFILTDFAIRILIDS
jgi:hypothetical protein